MFVESEAIEYTIPVLAPATVLIKAMAALREMTKTAAMDSKQINSLWCRKLNVYVKHHMNEDRVPRPQDSLCPHRL